MAVDNTQLLNFSLILAIIVLGLIGNVMSFIVFYKGKLCRALACSTYFRCLAVADSFVLLLPGLQLLIYLPPISIPYNNLNDFFCKISTFNVVFGAQVSAWIIVMVTVERTLTICRPLKFRVDSSFVRPYVKIAFIVLLFAATNCFYLTDNRMTRFSQSNNTDASAAGNGTEKLEASGNVTVTPEVFDNGTKENTDSSTHVWICYPGSEQLSNIYTIISIGVFSFAIPLLINLTCNILILVQLKNRLKDCTTGDGGSKNVSTKQNNLKNLIYRVLAISFVYCVSTGPVAVLIFIDHQQLPNYVVRLFNALYYVNSGVNFILYCVSGKDFRHDCVELFACKGRNDKANRAYRVA